MIDNLLNQIHTLKETKAIQEAIKFQYNKMQAEESEMINSAEN